MKLSKKIFLSIYIPTLLSLITISSILIYNNHIKEKNLIIDTSLQQMTTINNSIEDNTQDGKYDALQILKVNQVFFYQKNISFEYYGSERLEYNSDTSFKLNNQDILKIQEYKIPTIIEKHNKKHYLFAAFNMNDDIVVYKKSIESIYSNMYKNIRISLYTIVITNIFIIIVAYLLSKYITNPLNKLNQEMKKISNGNYDIKLKEGKDELGELSKNFNNMAHNIKTNNEKMLENIENKQLFIDNLAHEMNTPLTSIKGYAEALENIDLNSEQKHKYLKYIQDESIRIRDMYKKLLILAYNDDIEFKEIDFNKLINNLKIDLKDKLNNHHLIINNKCNSFYGDEMLISICLSNLIRNAINNSKENTNITINTHELNNKKYIEIIDEGIGISKNNIDKIFEPFYRVDKNRSRNLGGAGLGLTLVKNIIDRHNAKIYVESKINEGSRFILEFNKNEDVF